MRRRDFMALLGGAAAWPMAAVAQQSPVIGFLHVGSPEAYLEETAAFRKGLNQIGYVEGQNIAIEYRWAEGQRDRLPAMTADLIGRRVAVIAAMPSSAATAAKAATTTLPIVFNSAIDPVSLGLVASINRPGGNITGISQLTGNLDAKRLELLRELVPNAAVIGLLVNPNNLNAERDTKELQATALTIGQQLIVLNASNASEIEKAFTTLNQQRAGALIVGPDVIFSRQVNQLITLSARHKMPTMYIRREYPVHGGLISYGTDQIEVYRQTGFYTGRILKGNKPADLPIIQLTKIELVINLKTAKALNLDVPPTLLARADEVIE